VFAFGAGVEKRHPGASDFISLHASILPARRGYVITIDPIVAGLNNPADRLEFSYEIKAPNGQAIFVRPWKSDPTFTTDLPPSFEKSTYIIEVKVRSAYDENEPVTSQFALNGLGSWRIGRGGDESEDDSDF